MKAPECYAASCLRAKAPNPRVTQHSTEAGEQRNKTKNLSSHHDLQILNTHANIFGSQYIVVTHIVLILNPLLVDKCACPSMNIIREKSRDLSLYETETTQPSAYLNLLNMSLEVTL